MGRILPMQIKLEQLVGCFSRVPAELIQMYSPIVICGRPMRQPRDCSVAARARAGARAACFSAASRRCRSFSAVCLLSASCSATSLKRLVYAVAPSLPRAGGLKLL